MKTLVLHPSLIQKRFPGFDFMDILKMFSQAREGLSPKVFYDFAQAISMPEKDLAALIGVSPRTISNYQEKNKKLNPLQSEHLLKLMALYRSGELVMGSLAEFSYWLNKPFWDRDERPIHWLITPGGVDLVSQELDQIAAGYPV